MQSHNNCVLLLLTLLTFSPTLGKFIYSPTGFFSSSDLTSITWAHAVNSQQVLTESLADPSIQMLEADICKGRTNISGVISPFDIAVMAHPPQRFSDLTFVNFIDQVIKFNKDKPLEQRKGVKLDFKDYFGAAAAIVRLGQRNKTENGTLQFPVWLNADILQGPVDSPNEPKFNATPLFTLHKKNLPNAVLSLGWTTRFGPQSSGDPVTKGSYTREQIAEMIAVVHSYGTPEEVENLPLTFAVRAGIVANSLGNVMYLLNGTTHKATITLWAGADDPPVDMTVMDDFFKLVGKNRAFVDVPFDFKQNSAGSLAFDLAFVLFGCLVRYVLCQLAI